MAARQVCKGISHDFANHDNIAHSQETVRLVPKNPPGARPPGEAPRVRANGYGAFANNFLFFDFYFVTHAILAPRTNTHGDFKAAKAGGLLSRQSSQPCWHQEIDKEVVCLSKRA